MLIALSVHGEDKPGLVHAVAKALASCNANIVDIEQTVLQGIFAMFIVAETENFECVEKKISEISHLLGIKISLSPFERRQSKEKNLYVINVLGKDRIGIVRDITGILLNFGINIEKTSLTARDKLISIEFIVDAGKADLSKLKRELLREGEKIGLDIVVQKYESAFKEKRLIVFDLDSTLIDAEIIDELAREAGVEKEVKELTHKAMNGEMSFKEALQERVKLLRGLPVEVLEKIYSRVEFTEGAKELISALKRAGYKIAVVSGSFTYFTNRIKEELGLDYAFGNELEIIDGKLTGKIKGRIIDAEEKARILEEIARKEGVKIENVVAVGDGANDRIMIEKAGLGIAFNAKKILKEIADGNISKNNLIGLASVLKLPSEFTKRL
ncbi:MAG: phosphoserine phosphatase SerB [Archaeoglobaceae archaeon]|nr:phosphoserine phosphatase SerB [Archaeoglobaceae archaeon]MDW8117573.1 phosphoserine phosphatase SerB [Archaeoglobaceae archaeon]